MEREERIIDLVSRFMNEELIELNDVKRAYNSLKSFYINKFIPCLDNGLYNDNATIVSNINDVFKEAVFFDSMPKLFGKKIINIFSEYSDFREYLEELIESDFDVFSNSTLPIILFDRGYSTSDSISVVTYADRLISISKEELGIILTDFTDNNIENRKLIKLIVLEKSLKYHDTCFCFWPTRVSENIEFERFIIDNSSKNFIICDSVSHVKHRMMNLNVDSLYTIGSENNYKTLKDELSEKKKKRVKGNYTKQEFYSFLLEDNNGLSCNISNRIQLILLCVKKYYHDLINHIRDNESNMKENIVHLSEGNTRDKISLYLNREKAKKNKYTNASEEFQTIADEMLENVFCYQRIRNRIYFNDESEYSFYYDSYIEDVFVDYAMIGENNKALECLNCIRNSNNDNIKIYEIFLDFCSKGKINKDSILFNNIINYNHAIAKMLIRMSSSIEIPMDILINCSKYIDNPSTENECYIFGIIALNNNEYKEAANYLKLAYEKGYEEAAEILLDIAVKYGYESNLSIIDLSKMMIPEANYIVGTQIFDENYEEAFSYFKLAAAKKHIESISLIADVLFSVVNDFTKTDVEKQDNIECIINAITLYEYLLSVDDNEEYRLKVGLIYLKYGDYIRALEYLEMVDNPEAYYQCAIMYERGQGVAVDIKRAREYYKKCGNYKDAPTQFVNLNEAIRNRNNTRAYNNDFSERREEISVTRSGACFITTAACLALKKDKYCDELNCLRAFRDTHISDGGIGDLLISEYYRIGPDIVSNIDREWNSDGVYMQLWEYYIVPSYRYIKEEKFEEAKMIYINMVKRLCLKYSILVDPLICSKFGINYN